MIEWILGAVVLGALGSLFGGSGSSTTGPQVPRQPLAIKLEDSRSAKAMADRLSDLRAQIEDLASLQCYPSTARLPTSLVEASQDSGRLLRALKALPATLGDTGRLASFLTDPAAFREAAIATFVKAQLVRWNDLFDRIGSGPLTLEQRLAVVTDEGATLVLASAGSGKTSVITAKAAYLVEAGIRPASEVLMLAFNKDAVGEMKARLDAQGVTGVGAYTFHGLANFIIGAVEGRKPPVADHATDERAFRELIEKILRELFVARSGHAADILAWFGRHRFDPRTAWDFPNRTDFVTHAEGQRLRSLQGNVVRSYEELLIANWLFVKGVDYEYEPIYEHDLTLTGKKDYQPDFRLKESGIYLEHFGVRRERRLDGTERLTTAPFVPRDDYLASMEWKRRVHAEHGTTLVETYSYEQQEAGGLTEALARKLAKHEVTLRPRSREHMWTAMNRAGEVSGLAEFMGLFLRRRRAGGHDLASCLAKAKALDMEKRAGAFLKIFEPVLEAYQRRLGRFTDFEGMIWRALDHVEAGRFASPFRHILVDEAQDISPAYARLLRALKAQHGDAHLFAVGDDWQSINRFAGADLEIMRSFGTIFGGRFGGRMDVHRSVELSRTFRSVDRIALPARHFVLQNPVQIARDVVPAGKVDGPALRIVLGDEERALHETLTRILAEASGEERPDVRILARYGFHVPKRLGRLKHEFGGLQLTFSTIHKAKGLEADHVIVLGLDGGQDGYGFPSEIEDDPLLLLVKAADDSFPHAEERRLLYVAMTRARRTVTLLGSDTDLSPFVVELMSDPTYGVALSAPPPCSHCGGRILSLPLAGGGVRHGCEHVRSCGQTLPSCSACGRGLPVRNAAGSPATCSCGVEHPACPSCAEGWLVPKNGPHGPFRGCVRYPACTGKARSTAPSTPAHLPSKSSARAALFERSEQMTATITAFLAEEDERLRSQSSGTGEGQA